MCTGGDIVLTDATVCWGSRSGLPDDVADHTANAQAESCKAVSRRLESA
jgi:hypothetical protein